MSNKLYIFFAFALLSAVNVFGQNKKPVNLSGTIKGFDGEQVYLQRYDNKLFKTVDSAEIVDGRFAFDTSVQLPELYGVTFHPDNIDLQLFLDGNPTTIDVVKDQDLRGAKIKGSKLHDQFLSYQKRSETLTAKSFIEEDPNSVVAAFVLFRNYSYDLSPQEIREHLTLLDQSLAQTQYVRILKDLADKQEAVLPGNKAIDFVSKDVDGNEVRFFDNLGKGYVLLDFWAGWCPPCRAENPNIVKAYQKYKDKGFTVFGVSLDKKKESWLKAIEDDQLHWTQVSDLAFWDTEAPALYGVRFIPSNLLIGPDGVIVARNVAGQDLHDLLAKLLD